MVSEDYSIPQRGAPSIERETGAVGCGPAEKVLLPLDASSPISARLSARAKLAELGIPNELLDRPDRCARFIASAPQVEVREIPSDLGMGTLARRREDGRLIAVIPADLPEPERSIELVACAALLSYPDAPSLATSREATLAAGNEWDARRFYSAAYAVSAWAEAYTLEFLGLPVTPERAHEWAERYGWICRHVGGFEFTGAPTADHAADLAEMLAHRLEVTTLPAGAPDLVSIQSTERGTRPFSIISAPEVATGVAHPGRVVQAIGAALLRQDRWLTDLALAAGDGFAPYGSTFFDAFCGGTL